MNSDSRAKRAKQKPPPRRVEPQPHTSWVKKSHLKRNFAIFIGVILLVVVGAYAVSQSVPGSSARPLLISNSDWQTASLTDPTTGQSFTLGDFRGKIIVLQFMATYCQYCLAEGRQLVTVQQSLSGNSQIVMVSVDVDPNENVAQLKQYVQSNGFGAPNSNPAWHYAKDTTGQLLRSIAGNVDFGSFISLTNMYFIDRSQSNNFMTMQRGPTQEANPASDIVAVVNKLL